MPYPTVVAVASPAVTARARASTNRRLGPGPPLAGAGLTTSIVDGWESTFPATTSAEAGTSVTAGVSAARAPTPAGVRAAVNGRRPPPGTPTRATWRMTNQLTR